MALSDLTRSAVSEAIKEFDSLGRQAFLKKYGFRKARDYMILNDGVYYDSKAIAGAAHGYLPGSVPLSWREFSGGEVTVARTMEGLGFKVVGPRAPNLPAPGKSAPPIDAATSAPGV